ncbi:MAG: hypothetical protein K6F32_01555 [Bacilli bacterium]|nr:hypothetical protein [Bacilli bacterium]
MKKKVTLLSIIGLILFGGGIALFFFLPAITNKIFGFDTALLFDWPTIQQALTDAFSFASMGVYQIAFIATLAVVGLLWIIHLIVLIVKKHPLALLESLAWLIGSAALLFALVILWTPAMFTSGDPLTQLKATDGYQNAPFFIYLIATYNGASDSLRVLYMILGFLPPVLVLVGFILCLIGLIVDFRYLGSIAREGKKEKKELDASGLDNVVVVHEDESPSSTAGAEDLGKEGANAGASSYKPAAAESEYQNLRPAGNGQGGVGQSSINGPFLIQYINTYAPEHSAAPSPAPAPAEPAKPAEEKKEEAGPLSADDIRKIIREEMNADKKPERPLIIAVPSPSRKKSAEPAPAPTPAPENYITADDIRSIVASEIKNALGESEDVVVEPVPPQALTADDIRSIVSEELKAAQKAEEPKEEPKEEKKEEKKLSEADVRDVIRQELLAFRDAEDEKEKKEKEAAERKAAEEAARQAEIEAAKKEAVAKALEEQNAAEEEKPASLSAEDIRRIIAEEFAKQTPAEEPAPKAEEKPAESFDPEAVRAMLREEIRAAQPIAEEKVAPVTVVVKQAEPEPEPVVEQSAEEEEPSLSAEDIRQIIRETIQEQAAEEPEPEPEPAEPALTADDVKQIIADALAAQAAEKEPEPEPEPTEPALTADDVRQIIAEALAGFTPAPAPEPEPEPEPVVEQAAVVEEPAPAPVVVAVPAPEPEENPNKIIRIPFPTRMIEAEDEMRANYNELKSELLAYGVKSRVSNSGDTFRLHKVTFVKITIAGKSLKLYFALDPKDYENTTLPIQDVSHKNIYKDIPLVFKVKSELSMRRAKQLINDVMEKNGLEQGRVELRDHASSLTDYIAAGTREAEDDED